MNKINFQNGITPLNDTNLNQMQTNIENAIEGLFLRIYPVGSIYISLNSTNPSQLFGGTWQSIEGQFLIGVGSHTDINNETWEFEINQSGGEYSHKLTIDEMASHNHIDNGLSGAEAVNAGGSGWTKFVGNVSPYSTENTGGDQAHNNMPPYLAVYMWKRIA